MSRGNRRETVFHDQADYEAFIELMRVGTRRVRMRLLAWCLMPNHVHFVPWPVGDDDLSRWMHWLLTAHVQRHRVRHATIGRIWQGRFKAPPIQQDDHLLTVIRYVERNPLRAGIVGRAEDWPWSSLGSRLGRPNDLLYPSPVPLGEDWIERVNHPLTQKELEAVRSSLRRGRPLGDPAWMQGTAERLGLLSSLRPRGRPPSRERSTR